MHKYFFNDSTRFKFSLLSLTTKVYIGIVACVINQQVKRDYLLESLTSTDCLFG